MTSSGGLSVAHLWRSYLPGGFNDPHPYLLQRDGTRSQVVAADLLDNGSPVPAHTSWVRRREVTRSSPAGRAGRVWERGTGELAWRRFERRCTRLLAADGPVVVHAHFGTTGARAVSIVERTRLPLVVSFYGVDASAALNSQVWRRRYRQMFPHADLILVLCDEVKQRLAALGCPEDKIVVLNMAAGVEDFPYRPPAPAGTVRFIIAARFVEKKGYPILLEAFSRLVAEGRDVSLLAVGYGPAPVVEDRAASLGVASRVTVVDTKLQPDFHRTFNDALRESDIFVLPSIMASDGDDEGGPALTLVCAQAAGLPVICTRFPGADLSVTEGVTGIYCEADAESLSERMRWLMDRPELWGPLGKRASEHVAEHFSLEGQMGKLTALYEGVVRRG